MISKKINIEPAGWNGQKRLLAIVTIIFFLYTLFFDELNGISILVFIFFAIFISFVVYRRAIVEISDKEIKITWILFVLKVTKIKPILILRELSVHDKVSQKEKIIEFIFEDGDTFGLPQNHNMQGVAKNYDEIKEAILEFKQNVVFRN